MECFVCGKPSKLGCGKCKLRHYCSQQCQLFDWIVHKDECKIITEHPERIQQVREEISKLTGDNYPEEITKMTGSPDPRDEVVLMDVDNPKPRELVRRAKFKVKPTVMHQIMQYVGLFEKQPEIDAMTWVVSASAIPGTNDPILWRQVIEGLIASAGSPEAFLTKYHLLVRALPPKLLATIELAGSMTIYAKKTRVQWGDWHESSKASVKQARSMYIALARFDLRHLTVLLDFDASIPWETFDTLRDVIELLVGANLYCIKMGDYVWIPTGELYEAQKIIWKREKPHMYPKESLKQTPCVEMNANNMLGSFLFSGLSSIQELKIIVDNVIAKGENHEGPRVLFDSDLETIMAKAQTVSCTIVVADGEAGITPEKRKMVFQQYKKILKYLSAYVQLHHVVFDHLKISGPMNIIYHNYRCTIPDDYLQSPTLETRAALKTLYITRKLEENKTLQEWINQYFKGFVSIII